jgi:hypothetical protein
MAEELMLNAMSISSFPVSRRPPLKGSNWSKGEDWICEAGRTGKLVSVAVRRRNDDAGRQVLVRGRRAEAVRAAEVDRVAFERDAGKPCGSDCVGFRRPSG